MTIKQENSEQIQLLEAKIDRLTQELQNKDKQLEETQKLLKEREKMASLGEMAASIFHDLRNYLSSINDHTEVNLIRCQYVEKILAKVREWLGEETFSEILTNNLEEGEFLSNLKKSLVYTENKIKEILIITSDINIYLYNQQGQKLSQQKPNLEAH